MSAETAVPAGIFDSRRGGCTRGRTQPGSSSVDGRPCRPTPATPRRRAPNDELLAPAGRRPSSASFIGVRQRAGERRSTCARSPSPASLATLTVDLSIYRRIGIAIPGSGPTPEAARRMGSTKERGCRRARLLRREPLLVRREPGAAMPRIPACTLDMVGPGPAPARRRVTRPAIRARERPLGRCDAPRTLGCASTSGGVGHGDEI